MNTKTKEALILSLAPHFSKIKFKNALEASLDIGEIIAKPSSFKKSLSLREETIRYLEEKNYNEPLEKISKWIKSPNHSIVCYFDDNYPYSLKQISDPPILLYCVGDTNLLASNQLAIVGSRNYSTYGRNVTDKIITELADSNLTITSGLAFGIDTLAHEFSLKNNLKTIAVIGTGINIVYPASNRALYEKIAKNGLIVSEFPIGTKPLRHNFPLRNRLISGLSKGVLVIEAASKSGSLITAKLALDQNKEVFAIPGSIFNSTSQGCNDLINQGAKLVRSADDIMEELLIDSSSQSHTTAITPIKDLNLEPKQLLVYESISDSLTTIDKIVNITALNYSKITEILFDLEMQNLIQSIAGGYTKL
ncbi:MAG: DNA processing protein [Francisella sp.]|jgi:DNA processing protein